MKEQMDVGGYKYTYVDNYNIELDKPDIMLFYIANTDVHFNFYRGGGRNHKTERQVYCGCAI